MASTLPEACRTTPAVLPSPDRPPSGEPADTRPRPDHAGGTHRHGQARTAQAPRERALDEAAVRRSVRSEVEAAMQPLMQRLGQLEAQGSQTTAAAFAASAAGNLSSWALTHPEQAEHLLGRLAALLDEPSGLSDVE
jgi:hypothetical protein